MAAVTLAAFLFLPSALSPHPTEPQPFCVTHRLNTPLHTLNIAAVGTTDAMRTGLMLREDLAPEEGMLFLRGGEREASFWMKNTPLPLDIVFLDSNFRVIRVGKGVPGSLDPVRSGAPSPFVLELKAGEAEKNGMVPGYRLGPFKRMDPEPPCRA